MTHVFIVNEQTMKIHLEYMFAGTGGSTDASFLHDKEIKMHWKTEFNVVDMISDVSRIKSGDRILFYVQASQNVPGKFYGLFKAKGAPFYDSNENNYLYNELDKSLNFRIEIEPDEVYADGISEHDALDILDEINHPSQMCWSLIYRKLRANRGCTMITDYEADRIIKKIRIQNKEHSLNGKSFTYDTTNNKIIKSKNTLQYEGNMESLSIKERMIVKYNRNNAFEAHLQAYIIQHYLEYPLKNLLDLKSDKNIWIGNEVACGVGMQRIDIATVQEDDSYVTINIIELKSRKPYDSIIKHQLPWYIEWVQNYWCPLYDNKTIIIKPVVIALKTADNTEFKNISSTLKYSNKYNEIVLPVEFISFEINNNDITFKKEF